ncbi:phage portal protein [Vibrio toranzoniae]|uniref:phage portal protein n=1 Tax=Vibrio toranzoniae TaxID=1194427 RepID=UPI001376752F|nr:phage portal protein [Vibrio toranzoniae]NAZ69698.1 phage portal protein [Vibrio toranzoniae]
MWPFKRKEETETRSYTLDQLSRLMGYGTSSGVEVNQTNAQSVSAVFSAMSFISKQVSGYPVVSNRDVIDGLFRISPDGVMTAYQWRVSTMLNLLASGNAYSYIHWGYNGMPERIEFLLSSRVSPIIEQHTLKGYHVDGKPVLTRNILHFKINSEDGLTGRSPITICREAVGVGIKQNENMGQQLKNNFKPSGVIEIDAMFKDENALTRLMNRMREREKGDVLVLERGMTLKSIGMTNADAEFIEHRKFSVDEVARMFNLDKIWLQNSGTGAKYDEVNASQKSLLVNTIQPYLNTIEAELTFKLIDATIRFNLSEIQRLDVSTRYEIYQKLIDMELLTPDEVKEREGL